MGRKLLDGIYFNQMKHHYYINKIIAGKRYHRSTGSTSRTGAERVLRDLLDRTHLPTKPSLTFRDAVIRFLLTSIRKDLNNDASRLTRIYPFLADLPLDQIDGAVIDHMVHHFKSSGRKSNTINAYLSLIRVILNTCAQSWKTDAGEFWLKHVPKIKTIRVTDERLPYPISWSEQRLLFACLPNHLLAPIEFCLHTGLRNREICTLRWSDLRTLPDSTIEYFLIPAKRMKNGKPRLVLLNRVAREIIGRLKRVPSNSNVFLYNGKPMTTRGRQRSGGLQSTTRNPLLMVLNLCISMTSVIPLVVD